MDKRFTVVNRIVFILIFSLFEWNSFAAKNRIIYDRPNSEMESFFVEAGAKYIIRYNHTFDSRISVPEGCEIYFEGGSLRGPIFFYNTLLTGNVNLKGSYLEGAILNSVFYADWMCSKDGSTDDAAVINNLISICNHICFPAGIYELKSTVPSEGQNENLRQYFNFHIGINRSNICLEGEPGCVFETKLPYGIVGIYSAPYSIEERIGNIFIRGIEFRTINDGASFYEVSHSIKTMGVNGLEISNCFFNDFWGDAICLSHMGDNIQSGEIVRNSNIRIVGNTIIGGGHYNTRNGISVIGGENVLIRDNLIVSTSRDDMPGAIDVEAPNSVFVVKNIHIVNNTISDCHGTAGGICIHTNKFGGQAYDIIISKNYIENSRSGLAFVVQKDNCSGSFIITENIVENDTYPYQFVGQASTNNWIMVNNIFKSNGPALGGSIKFNNSIFKNNIVGNRSL